MSYLSKAKDNNIFFRYLIAFFVLEILSYLSWAYPNISWISMILISIIVLILISRDSKFFLYIPLAEIFWGSLGHSFDYSFLSTRLLIFVLIVILFVLKNIKDLRNLKIFKDKALFYIYLSLIFLILVNIFSAYLSDYNINNIFFDANAYFYILYLPIWYQVFDKSSTRYIFEIIKAAAVIISIKTLLLLNIFSQNYSFLNNELIYKWVRDTRTGEITPFKDSFFRIFLQSQFYLILAWFWIFLKQLKDFSKSNFFILTLISSAILVSLSRSFWLGAFVAFVFLLVNIFVYNKRALLPLLFYIVLASISAVLWVEAFYNLPKYHNINIFDQRSTSVSEPAASTRAQLWGPMWQSISERPIVGHGFGKELSFRSNDPRIKNQENPEGWHTTYSFEWGWMDQLLKGGLLLVSVFVAWLVLIYQRAYIFIREQGILALILLSTLTSLLIIHIFTPYINHPLGLSFLMLSTIIFSPYAKKAKSYY